MQTNRVTWKKNAKMGEKILIRDKLHFEKKLYSFRNGQIIEKWRENNYDREKN